MKRIAHPALMLAVALLVSNSAESGARALASDRQAALEERVLLDRAPPTSADVVHELSGEYAGCTAFHAIEPQSGASQVVVEGDGELCQNLDRHHTRYGTAISDPTDAPHSSPGELYGCLSCHAIDTSSGENRFLIERECRACHRPDRHHLLYGSAVRQPTAAPYSTSFDWYDCLSCHEIEAVSGSTHFLIERDCGACHDTRRVESVFVDIKPGSDLNRIQAEPRGVLPVAILGSRSYDVTEIDASSLLLEGEVVPLRGGLEEREDGTLDLTLKFSAAAVAAALGGLRPGQSYEVSITGAFGDGTPFVGSDTVVVARSRRRSRTDQP